MITLEHRTQFHHNFYTIITMEKVVIGFTANKDAVKRLIYNLGEAMSVLVEVKDNIDKGFKDLKKLQDALAADNGGINVDGSEIMDINTGGGS